ncbi:MAG: hypothetical protein KF774_20490, partial [Planctomyces sp.]|nr:hypothetical protein [Planctomyces sp.]
SVRLMPTVHYDFEGDSVGSAPAGCTLRQGASITVIDDSGGGGLGSKAVRGVQSSSQMYFTLDDIPACQGVDMQFRMRPDGANTLRSGVGIFRANPTVHSTGYLVQWDYGTDNRIELHRQTAAASYSNVSPTPSTGSMPATTDFRWRVTASVSGPTCTITAYSWNGSAWVQAHQWTDGTHLSGHVGFLGVTNLIVDDISVDYTPIAGLALDWPMPHFCRQRRASDDRADLPIAGTYSGDASAGIEARFNGGTWQTVVPSPSGGAFDVLLPDQSVGQGTVDVRFVGNPAVSVSVANVRIGDVAAATGQSNADGRGTSAQNHTPNGSGTGASAWNASVGWKSCADPTSGTTNVGSVWPLVSTKLLDDRNVPVGWLCVAVGGTGSSYWANGGTGYTALLNSIANSRCGGLRWICHHQGETDAISGVAGPTYAGRLDTMADGWDSAIAWHGAAPRVIVAQLGQVAASGNTADDADLDVIRAAQAGAWSTNSRIRPGPVLWDVAPLTDKLHFRSNAHLNVLAERWRRAINAACFGATPGRGPRLQAIQRTGTQVTITFDSTLADPGGPYTSAVFVVRDSGLPMTLAGASRLAANIVLVELATEPSGIVTVSMGSGSLASLSAAPTVPMNTVGLPAEPFFNQLLQTPSGSAGGVPLIGAGLIKGLAQ